jgi:hypothetical protein
MNWAEPSSYARPWAEVYRYLLYCDKKLYFKQFFGAILKSIVHEGAKKPELVW